MGGATPVFVSGAVEGLLDEAVLRRLLQEVGCGVGPIYGKRGKEYLEKKIQGYNSAARFNPWVVLVDLDHSADCAPLLRSDWLPTLAPYMCFRVAVMGIEAWLFADQERISRFLSVRLSQIPINPDLESDPKNKMIQLAAKSRRREIREEMVPRPGSGRRVGPAYTSRLIEFVEDQVDGWRPSLAAKSSCSLNRCLRSLRSL